MDCFASLAMTASAVPMRNINNPINQDVSPQFTAEAAGSQNRFSRVRARSAIRSSGKRPITK
jgi:hypothetical protein